jgi:YD repeat-containing protein
VNIPLLSGLNLTVVWVAVQVKKDISVWDGTQQVEKRQVSGATKVDVRGLPTSQYLSVTEENDETQFPLLRFDRTMSTINPATTTYDYLGRALSASSPDASGTGSYVATVAYGWETKGSDDFYVTTATDPDGRVSKSYIDARGQQRFTISDPTGVNVEAEFFYDVLGQLTSSQSVDGETTTFTYDDFGRMTQEVHPDRGTTSMDYNMLGQVVSTTDANGQTVDYIYDFSRLNEIRYPTSGSLNDITYDYGSRGDGINGAGRVTQITQGSGTTPVMVEKMNYDDLGNVAVHTREIDVPNIGVQSFTSKTECDSWGRILNMTYPDGEQLRYFHSYGGDLFRINGYDLGNTNLSAPTEVYIAQLGYDGYGNRTYMEYGNGTKTSFDYNANTLRLNQVTALTSTMNSTGVAQTMIDKTFSYSDAGNINVINNTARLHLQTV